MKKPRSQRGIVSIGCVTTMCLFTVLKKAPQVEPTREPPPEVSRKYKGHVQIQAESTKRGEGTGSEIDGKEGDDKPWEESFREGDSLYQSGHYDEAYKVWAETLKLAKDQKAAQQFDDARALPILDKLALIYKTQSRPKDAACAYERAISIGSKVYGKDSQQVAHTMLELGHVYRYGESKNLNKAEEVLTEAFAINEKLYGRLSIPAGDVAIALAQLEEDQGQTQKAIDNWKLAIDIGNRLEPNVISCCRIGPRQGLARCYEKSGQFDDALQVHKELLEMCKKGAPSMLATVQSAYDQCLRNMNAQAGPPANAH